MTLNVALVLTGEASGAQKAAADTVVAVRSIGVEARQTATQVQAANDSNVAAIKRANEALAGQAALQQRVQQIVNGYAGVRAPTDDASYRQRAADIAAFGAQLDRIRAQYDPLFAAQRRHVTALQEIDQAERVGAISATLAIQARLKAIATINAETSALNGLASARKSSAQAAVDRVTIMPDRAADIAHYGEELDRLRARFSPIYAASKQYEEELANIDRAHRLGAISTGEHGQAIAMLNERYTAQQKLASAGLVGVGRSAGLTANQLLNLSRQGNDVITMFALGAPPLQIFASQIGQIYDALESGPRGLKGSLQGLVQMTKQAGIGLLGFLATPAGMAVGAGLAAVAGVVTYVVATRKELKSLDVLLKEHTDVLQSIGFVYESIGKKAQEAFSKSSANGLLLASSATQAGLRLQVANQTQGLMGELGSFVSPGKSAGGYFGVYGEFKPFAEAIEQLRKTARAGSPDIIGFRKAVEDKWASEPNNAALTATAGRLMDMTKDAIAAARALLQLKLAQEEIARSKGPGGLPLRGGLLSTEDATSYNQYLAVERVAANRARQAAQAERDAIFARSPAQIAAVARVQAEAQYNDNESNAARRLRVELAETQALTQATHALAEAQRQRSRSLDETMASARLDVDLIGKNAAETARLRMEHQLIAQVRNAAADAGVKADEAEIARIRERSAEYAKYVALQSARQMLVDQGDELDKLRLESALIGSSAATRARAMALMEAEQQIRRDGIDTMGREAQLIRQNALAIGEMNVALDRQRSAWENVQRAGESAIDSLLDGDWKSAANDIIKSAIDFNIGNPLKNWVFGSGLPTGADLGGIWGKLFGGADQDPAGLVSSILGGGKDVGAMTVNAGTVMVTGSIGAGGGLGGLMGNVQRLLTGANDNASGGGVMSRIWSFFSGKGLADHQVAGIMGNIGAESSFNPGAVNPTSGAYGLFQHLGSRLSGLGGGAGLEQQLSYAWKELQTTEAGVLKKLLGSTDVRSATGAFAGFERAGGWSKANPEGIELWQQRLSGAQASLEKFGGTVTAANQNLGQFGNGLGQFGNALSQFPAAPGGGAGGILGALFGGLNSSFSGTKAFNWLTANPGGSIGLYDRGGWTGPGGKFDPAGIVHRDEYVFSSEATRAIGVSNLDRLHSAARTGFASGGYGGGSGPARESWSMSNGRSVIEVRLSEGLVVQLLQQANNQTVEIVQANQRNREALYQAGDSPR